MILSTRLPADLPDLQTSQRETRSLVEDNLATCVSSENHMPLLKYLDWLEKYAIMTDWKVAMSDMSRSAFDVSQDTQQQRQVRDIGHYDQLTRTLCKLFACILDRKRKSVPVPIGPPYIRGCARFFDEYLVQCHDLVALWELVTHDGTFAHLCEPTLMASHGITYDRILTTAWAVYQATGELVLALQSTRYHNQWNRLYLSLRHGIEQVRIAQQEQIAKTTKFSPEHSFEEGEVVEGPESAVDYGDLANGDILPLPFPFNNY